MLDSISIVEAPFKLTEETTIEELIDYGIIRSV